MKNLNILKSVLPVILLIFSFNLLKAQEINFSGNWKRNTEKCYTIGITVSSIPVEVQLKQSPLTFEITRTIDGNDNKIPAYAEVLKFDGSYSQPVIVDDNKNRKSTIHWSADHKALIEQSEYIDDKGDHIQKKTETITLMNGSKTLMIKSVIDDGDRLYKMVGIFDRKE